MLRVRGEFQGSKENDKGKSIWATLDIFSQIAQSVPESLRLRDLKSPVQHCSLTQRSRPCQAEPEWESKTDLAFFDQVSDWVASTLTFCQKN